MAHVRRGQRRRKHVSQSRKLQLNVSGIRRCMEDFGLYLRVFYVSITRILNYPCKAEGENKAPSICSD
jgi:hypothetical protein